MFLVMFFGGIVAFVVGDLIFEGHSYILDHWVEVFLLGWLGWSIMSGLTYRDDE